MKKISFSFILLFGIAFTNNLKSQTNVSIPAFTAYAVPTEESNEDDESDLFSAKDGLHNWTNAQQQIQFYFNLRTTGQLNLSLLIKNDVAGKGGLPGFPARVFLQRI